MFKVRECDIQDLKSDVMAEVQKFISQDEKYCYATKYLIEICLVF